MKLGISRGEFPTLICMGAFMLHQVALWGTTSYVLLSPAGPLGRESDSALVDDAREFLGWLSGPTSHFLRFAEIQNPMIGLLAQVTNGLFWALLAGVFVVAVRRLRARRRAVVSRNSLPL